MSFEGKEYNPHNYCVIDDCENICSINCKKCDGDFCLKHFEEGHKKGVCIYE